LIAEFGAYDTKLSAPETNFIKVIKAKNLTFVANRQQLGVHNFK
tara:strand:+ start:29 stop:160 length:132 start_codon:yes stop_codon:yes gene_type:complete